MKYHLGTSTDVEIAGHQVHVSLQPNPSHLEAVNPVVVGKVRARQDTAGDTQRRSSVMAILMHGDAAFAGQGLVYETLAMSQLIGYRTGGTIHLVVNNQIGFTTVPAHAYSGLVLHRCREVDPGADPARQRRRPRGGDLLRAHGGGIPHALRRRHRAGHRLLSTPRPQRDRRTGLHPAGDVSRDRQHEDHPHPVRRTAGSRGRGARGGSAGDVGRVPGRHGGGQSGGAGLQAEQGGLAGGPLVRLPSAGARIRASGGNHRRPCGDAEADRHGAVARAGRLRGASAASPASSKPSRRCWSRASGIDWATGEALGVRLAAAGGQPRSPVRRGLPARHVQPAPCGADRSDQPARIHPAEQHRPRAGEDRDLQLVAVGGRRARASSTATRWPIRARWCCGRRSSATSPTARR